MFWRLEIIPLKRKKKNIVCAQMKIPFSLSLFLFPPALGEELKQKWSQMRTGLTGGRIERIGNKGKQVKKKRTGRQPRQMQTDSM